MSLQAFLDKIIFDPSNPGFEAQTKQLITNLYNTGGIQVQSMLDALSVDPRDLAIIFKDNDAVTTPVFIPAPYDRTIVSIGMDYDWITSELLYLSEDGVAVNCPSSGFLEPMQA